MAQEIYGLDELDDQVSAAAQATAAAAEAGQRGVYAANVQTGEEVMSGGPNGPIIVSRTNLETGDRELSVHTKDDGGVRTHATLFADGTGKVVTFGQDPEGNRVHSVITDGRVARGVAHTAAIELIGRRPDGSDPS